MQFSGQALLPGQQFIDPILAKERAEADWASALP
jgi:hypothetical protein